MVHYFCLSYILCTAVHTCGKESISQHSGGLQLDNGQVHFNVFCLLLKSMGVAPILGFAYTSDTRYRQLKLAYTCVYSFFEYICSCASIH